MVQGKDEWLMDILGNLDKISGIIAIIALGIATYVNLSIKPIKDEIQRYKTMLANYERFRGIVETTLIANTKDQTEIKHTLEYIRHRLDDMYKNGVYPKSHSSPS